jgi:threonylcarbamoyladenosine tRNA methylthiotransferase MtaB
MRTFSTTTLGCKVNQYESQQIRQLLEQFGLNLVETAKKSHLIVVNTCCVTHTASAKSRQYIRKARRFNPDAVIVVCGCLPTVLIGELNGLDKNTYIISNRQSLADELSRIVNGQSINHNLNDKNNLAARPDLPQLTCFKGHTRAFLKVQDGCDGFCTYCIVPKTRPIVQSKPLELVLQEAQALVEAGHKEIVITGVFLGAYGQQTVRRKNWPDQRNGHLADLLDKMAKIPNLARIRLSSLEPADVTPRLLDTFCENPNIMPHLHLSLQSGSDAVLKKMCRQYNADEFRDKVQLIKSRLDRPAITTDIIVGFPGETDADFEQTIDLAKDVGFAKMHIFGFSSRKGTPAAAMQDKVPDRVVKERSKMLKNLEMELGKKFRQQFLGETVTILTENSNSSGRSLCRSRDGQPCGRSERYFMVYLEDSEKKPKQNELLKIKLLENTKTGIIAEAL